MNAGQAGWRYADGITPAPPRVSDTDQDPSRPTEELVVEEVA